MIQNDQPVTVEAVAAQLARRLGVRSSASKGSQMSPRRLADLMSQRRSCLDKQALRFVLAAL
jgi:hypothetical protein